MNAPKQTRTEKKLDLFHHVLEGQGYVELSGDFNVTATAARTMSLDIQGKLWKYIKEQQILHPYTITAYPHAHVSDRGDREGSRHLVPSYLTLGDLRAEKQFWFDLIAKFIKENGYNKGELTPDDNVERLDISARVVTALWSNNLDTIGQVVTAVTSGTLRGSSMIGQYTYLQILEALEKAGFDAEPARKPTVNEMLRQATTMLRDPARYTLEQRTALAENMEDYLSNK